MSDFETEVHIDDGIAISVEFNHPIKDRDGEWTTLFKCAWGPKFDRKEIGAFFEGLAEALSEGRAYGFLLQYRDQPRCPDDVAIDYASDYTET